MRKLNIFCDKRRVNGKGKVLSVCLHMMAGEGRQLRQEDKETRVGPIEVWKPEESIGKKAVQFLSCEQGFAAGVCPCFNHLNGLGIRQNC